MPKLRVQIREQDGTYRNPYLKGGTGIRWGNWRTVETLETLEAATDAWRARKINGLSEKRVVVGSFTVVDWAGRIWAIDSTYEGAAVLGPVRRVVGRIV